MKLKKAVHPSWEPLLTEALAMVEPNYLLTLTKNPNWLPGPDKIFNAFSSPLENTRYILFGESPYPRALSANGFAFWDAAVTHLWSKTGLSAPVNRATSLRNMIKMLLVAAGDLSIPNISQAAIADIDKSAYINTIDELFYNFINNGFLLLNASLVLSQKKIQVDAKAWQPFMIKLLELLANNKPDIQLVLMGNIAKRILAFPSTQTFTSFIFEHPYNISFISNPNVINFFQPFNLLLKQAE